VDIVGYVVLAATLASVSLLLISHFSPLLVLVLAVAVGLGTAWIAGTWRLRPRAPAAAGVAWMVSFLLAVPSAALTGESIFVYRDPGFYTLLARWLTSNPEARIPIPYGEFEGIATLDAASAGFEAVGSDWLVQGNHALPALAALLDAASSEGRVVLLSNVVLASCALVMLYAATRLVLGPWWGLLPMLAVGLSMPMTYFSRSLYTEPLTAGFTFAAVAAIKQASIHGRGRLYLLAGAFAGASAIMRIDGVLTLVFLLPVVAVSLVRPQAQRRIRHRNLAYFVAGGVATASLGYADLALLSPGYLAHHRDEVLVLVLLGVVSAFATAAAYLLTRLQPGRNHALNRLSVIAGVSVVVLLVVMLARPLIWEAHGFTAASSFLESVQVADGQPPDGTRSYDELTMNWVAWYLSWPTVLAAIAGLGIAATRAVKRWDAALASLVALALGVSVTYLNNISIVPDQIWAARRLLPVVIPTLAVAAVLLYQSLARARHPILQALGLLGAAWTCIAPALVTHPMYAVREHGGTVAELDGLCQAIADGRAILADPESRLVGTVTINVWCDVPALGVSELRPNELAAAAAASRRPLFVLTTQPSLVWPSSEPPPFSTTSVTRWQERVSGPPNRERVDTRRLWLGYVQTDGTVVPITAAQGGLNSLPTR
jgi:hypothetical protein